MSRLIPSVALVIRQLRLTLLTSHTWSFSSSRDRARLQRVNTEPRQDERDELKSSDVARNWVPPGHFYSPIPNLIEVKQRHSKIWRSFDHLPGIDFRIEQQRLLLRRLKDFYLQFEDHRADLRRFTFDNGLYSWSDATFYACMLQHVRPQRIIEVGSGYSTAVALDVNDSLLNGQVSITCIEPFPSFPFEVKDEIRLIQSPVQDVPLEVFQELEKGDLLFIDSTHVSKAGSDVNYLYLEVIPSLAAGVYIHVHDVFLNFEYPQKWIMDGRAWNEQYLLRALLCNNHSLEIVLMTSVLHDIDREWISSEMPSCRRNMGGSIYLKTKEKFE